MSTAKLEQQVRVLTIENEHLRVHRDKLVEAVGRNGELMADLHRYMAEINGALTALQARIVHIDVLTRYTL